MSAIDKIKGVKTKNFAVACYNDNSINELKEALKKPADKTDCKSWGIPLKNWKIAINAALKDKCY